MPGNINVPQGYTVTDTFCDSEPNSTFYLLHLNLKKSQEKISSVYFKNKIVLFAANLHSPNLNCFPWSAPPFFSTTQYVIDLAIEIFNYPSRIFLSEAVPS